MREGATESATRTRAQIKLRRCFGGLGGLFIAANSATALATDYSWTPHVRSMMRAEDNIRGANSNKQEAWGFDTGAFVNLSARSDKYSTEIIPKFNLRRFVIGDNLDADEYSVALKNALTGERWAAGLDFSYARDSTLTSEATVTGTVNNVTDRDLITVQPSISYAVSEFITIQETLAYSTVAYADAESTGFVDYDYISGSSAVSYEWRQDAEVFASFFVSDFDTPGAGSGTQSYGGKAGMTWHWSETFKTTGSVGWIASSFRFDVAPVAGVDSGSGGPTASVNLEKKFDRGVAKFDYSREVSPTSRGAQSSYDELAMNFEYRLATRITMRLDGLYSMQTAQVFSGAFNEFGRDLNRDYLEVRGLLYFRIDPEWGASISYRHGHRKTPNQFRANIADTNAVFFTVEFNGRPNYLLGGN